MSVQIIFYKVLMTLYFCGSCDSLQVIGQEVVLPGINDIFIQFKAQVRNTGETLLNDVALRPQRCCFYADKGKACELFKPVGEKVEHLNPDADYNLTMLYANFYILGRYGDCNATLSGNSRVLQKIHFGLFNTTLPESYTWLPYHLQDWLTGSQRCTSPDQDFLRRCEPVNCLYKYGGSRNLFDSKDQVCKKTLPCSSSPTSSLPKQGLDPDTNTCKSLEPSLSEDDLSLFYKQDESFMHNEYNVRKVREVVCVHGKLHPNNRSCTCDFGWSSDPHDGSPYDPITQIYYLCNTHALPSSSKLKTITAHMIKLLVFLVGLMLCACALSFVFFCCAKLWMIYRGSKGRNDVGAWFKNKFTPEAEEAREPLFGSAVRNQSGNAKVQRIETSWYNTEDSIYDKAVVHTKSKGKKKGELYLNPGDVLTDLEKVDIPGYWMGTCRDRRGIFPVSCAEFRRDGHPPTPLPDFTSK